MKNFKYSKEAISLINLYNKLYKTKKTEIKFSGLGFVNSKVSDNLLLASLFILIDHDDVEINKIKDEPVRLEAIIKLEEENIYRELTMFGIRWEKFKLGPININEENRFIKANRNNLTKQIVNYYTYMKNKNLLITNKEFIKLSNKYADIYFKTNNFNLVEIDVSGKVRPMEFIIATILFSTNYIYKSFYTYLPFINNKLFKTYIIEAIQTNDQNKYKRYYEIMKKIYEEEKYEYLSLPFKLVYNLEVDEKKELTCYN